MGQRLGPVTEGLHLIHQSSSHYHHTTLLYYLFVPLVKEFHLLNIFTYITFRAAGAAVTAIVLSFLVGPIILRRLDTAAN